MLIADEEEQRHEKARLEQLRNEIIERRRRESQEAKWRESEETRRQEDVYLGWARSETRQSSQPRKEQKQGTKKKSISCSIL